MIAITDAELRKLKGPNQILGEWKAYLLFVKEYCERHSIVNPVVLEIGTQWGGQKVHYEYFLDAVHIGIDRSEELSKPDILGDSHSALVINSVKERLDGRDVDILFIDGAHTYNDAMLDYLAYGPMTTGVIAFHDIRHEKEIARLWENIQEAEKNNTNLEFYSVGAWGNGWCELGIGIIAKKRRKNG